MSDADQQAALRIIDVNLNRCTEALRCIEDFARFALDLRHAAQQAKSLRHDVVAAFAPVRTSGLAARDAQGDVGAAMRTDAEQTRASLEDVAAAAFGRLREALRSLAEYSKLLKHPQLPETAERIRLAACELEQSLLLRGTRLRALEQAHLYVIVTESACRLPWLVAAEAALRGGAGCLQLREKGLTDRELLRRAQELRALTTAHGALLIVNDRPDVARLADADGVHLGTDDLPLYAARRILGGARLIGLSTHDSTELASAISEQPDYIAVGPMYQSATKERAVAGLAYLQDARQRTALPLVAIGGIDAERVPPLTAAGADVICVCSAVLGSDDPQAAAQALVAARTLRAGTAPASQ